MRNDPLRDALRRTTDGRGGGDGGQSEDGTATADRRSTLQALGAGGVVPFLPIGETDATASHGTPSTQWSKLFDQSGGSERFNALAQGPDGGFAAVGSTDQVGAARGAAWMVATDASGTESWRETFGGAFGDQRWFTDVTAVPCTGFAVAGNRETFTDDPEAPTYGEAAPSNGWFRRVDSVGTAEANRFYNAGSLWIDLESIVREPDGEFTVAGSLQDLLELGDETGWLQKTDADGNALWEQSYTGPGGDTQSYFNGHVQTSDCGYALAGDTGYPAQGWLLRTDATGAELWQQAYGTASDHEYTFADVVEASDGGFVLAGTDAPEVGQSDGWLVKVDPSGTKQWESTPGGGGAASLSAVARTADGGYIAAGTLERPDRFSDGWIVKTDGGGAVEWQHRFGAECEFARLNDVVRTGEGGYAAAGARRVCPSSWDGWIVKLG
jgi:hypothetical protein